ncbi:hypothetical protein TNCV_3477721 [Trichonephila clavipes]|nr:hypothetical protein TNCV_3477721 [Trichonephila clavipes]
MRRFRKKRLSPTFTLQRYANPTAGVMEPFFNKTMIVLTWEVCHKTFSILLLPFLGVPDSQSLERRVGHLTSLNELEAMLQQIWNEMSQDVFVCRNA